MEFLEWLATLPFAEWVQISEWGFPILLSFHSIGLAIVVGLFAMLDFRILGFGKSFPVSNFADFMGVAWFGFTINAISGLWLFAADGARLITNWPFQLKMFCVFLGVALTFFTVRELNFAAYEKASKAEAEALGEPAITRNAKILAFASLITWVVAIIGGRLIAYVIDAARFNVDF